MTEKIVLDKIRAWENQWNTYQPNDFEVMYDQWMSRTFNDKNQGFKKTFFDRLDQWLFHTHAYLQGTAVQNEARERILSSGRLFNEDIYRVEHMKELSIDKLTYLAQQQISKGKLYSLAQGGLTGTGGYLLMGIDFPLMVTMNLRVVQLIGLTFGYEVNHPSEMMVSLKVFHAATLPKRLQKQAWDELKQELQSHVNFVYEGNDELTDETWLDQPLKQTMKTLFILMFRKKVIQGLPLVSIALGATLNYSLTRQVSEFALRFYQYRYLLEKGQYQTERR